MTIGLSTGSAAATYAGGSQPKRYAFRIFSNGSTSNIPDMAAIVILPRQPP
jgi:hypothetical protein